MSGTTGIVRKRRRMAGAPPLSPDAILAAADAAVEEPAAAPRKVLLISLFHPELVRGGAQQVCHELFQGLKQIPGIEPILLASVDSSYPALYKSGARITGFDNRPNEFLYLSAEYDYVWHKTSSHLHVAMVEEFLLNIRPDVVHFHHFLTMFGLDLADVSRAASCRTAEDRVHASTNSCQHLSRRTGRCCGCTDRSLCTRASPVRCHQCFPDRWPEQVFFMREHVGEASFRQRADMFTTSQRAS